MWLEVLPFHDSNFLVLILSCTNAFWREQKATIVLERELMILTSKLSPWMLISINSPPATTKKAFHCNNNNPVLLAPSVLVFWGVKFPMKISVRDVITV